MDIFHKKKKEPEHVSDVVVVTEVQEVQITDSTSVAESDGTASSDTISTALDKLPERLEDNPHMKDTENLNKFADKAVESAGTLYRTVEIVRQGAVPIDLVVTTVGKAVEDFRALKDELHQFQRAGQISFEEIELLFTDILSSCSLATSMVQSGVSPDDIINYLVDIIRKVELFLEQVSKKCKDLQSLRKRTAKTWLAATSVASVAVGGAAAALCTLSGGAALPVLAPLIAFGASSTAVATASHIAFSPSLGAQVKDMDAQIKGLDVLRMQAGIVGRKAEANLKAIEASSTLVKKHWWQP